MIRKFSIFISIIYVLFSSVSYADIQAHRIFEGPVIHQGDVPGYSAIFNGDVWPLSDGRLVGLFRMAREGYQKVPADNERGYRLENYYSDIGLFTSDDLGKTWNFSRVFVAAHHQLETQINNLHRRFDQNNDLVERVVTSLQSLLQEGRQFDILEDPRFMKIDDGNGQQRFFVFVTDVPPELLSGEPTDRSYGTGALEIAFEEGPDIKILGYQPFGPRENKDNWVIPIVPNDIQRAQMKNIKALGLTISDTNHPVALALRVNKKVLLVPFGALEDIFQVNEIQWNTILDREDCMKALLKPDGEDYVSLGNNDQPKEISYDLLLDLILEHPEYLDEDWALWKWHFYHQTKNTNRLEYETWVEVIDGAGFPVFRLPYCLQKPEEDYEVNGDIGYVVFNAGNVTIDHRIYHFNGVADSSVAISTTDEHALLHTIIHYPVPSFKLYRTSRATPCLDGNFRQTFRTFLSFGNRRRRMFANFFQTVEVLDHDEQSNGNNEETHNTVNQLSIVKGHSARRLRRLQRDVRT